MALVNGTNYDHIDLQAVGGDVTRHKLQDTDGRAFIAPTEASSTASAAHAAGSYFILGGVLYQATADILSGGTITPGTNCTAVTVGGEVSKTNGAVSDLKSALDDLTDITVITTTETETTTQTLTPTWTAGYIEANGTPHAGGTDYNYSSPIIVTPGDTITIHRQSDGMAIESSRFVTAYKNGVANASLGGQRVSLPWIVPDNVDAVVFSISYSYGQATVKRRHTQTITEQSPVLTPDVQTLYKLVSSKKANRYIYNFDVAANGSYETDKQFEDICAYRICFFAKITSLTDRVIIGKAMGQSDGGAFAFDATKLYEYIGTDVSPVREQAHGLTLKDYVGIIIDMPYTATAKVTIYTNDINTDDLEHPTGSKYTWSVPFWRSRYGTITVSATDALTDCQLSYTCKGLITDSWIFGDSYLSNYGTDRWSAYLVSGGYTNYLLNGYPGRNSVQALASLKVDLALNRYPKRILWLMGMNDKDQESAPNANWLSSLQEVISICEENHIELVLCTIPNTPSENTKNTEKNAYVIDYCQQNGLRYIDFANAISADGSSTWYDGMLEQSGNPNNRVHPTTRGAVALYACAVTEVPELLL